MTAANTTAQQYLTQQIQSASKEQLLLMLFDGAIRFLKIARKAIDAGDVKTSHAHLLKTQKIITELMTSLDMEIGGEPARNLMALYEYYYYRLVQANLKKDGKMVDEVVEHLTNLRQTWDEAIRISLGQAPSEPKNLEKGLEKGRSPAMAPASIPHDNAPAVSRNYSA